MSLKFRIIEAFVVTLFIGAFSFFASAIMHAILDAPLLFVKEMIVMLCAGSFAGQLISIGIRMNNAKVKANNFDK